MKDIIEKLKGMDKKELGQAINQAKAFAQTPEGKELVQKVKNGNIDTKNSQYAEIMKEVEKNPDIAKAIFNILKG